MNDASKAVAAWAAMIGASAQAILTGVQEDSRKNLLINIRESSMLVRDALLENEVVE